MGNCLMAGQGQAPARLGMRRAVLPDSTGAVSLSKMCGSGMGAMMFAHDMLHKVAPRSANVVVATRRHGEHDERAAPGERPQGRGSTAPRRSSTTWRSTASRTRTSAARRWACSPSSASALTSTASRARRRTRSRWRRRSARRRPTRTAASTGRSRAVTLAGKGGDTLVRRDEQPFKAKLDKIAGLKPAFKKDGTITAATSSSISDGAAALVLMRQSTAAKTGATPIARIVAHAVHAQERQSGSRRRRSARSRRCLKKKWPAGRPRTSTCGK